ncbi:TIGR02808 family protein [Agarivorans sp. MS3-6]|nr:TIGR02808 family protein [Agarivorans sp. TSD2052]UPW20412.1 TIGR02808 family protein [Agarivorans sp. TSD2052]
MSTLESVFWHVLGYAAMPTIFVMGFVGVAVISLAILSKWDKDQ